MSPLQPNGSDLVSRARQRWQSGRAAPFVIADATTDVALGLVNVQFDDEEVAGVAVSVFPEARGRVAPRAFGLPQGGRRSSRLRRVYAEAAAENAASIRAIEKAGFQREGLLRAHCKTHGRRHDCVMFSVVPSDFADG